MNFRTNLSLSCKKKKKILFWNQQITTRQAEIKCKHTRSASVVRSPRLAAIGVAILSGLTLNFTDTIITIIITRPRINEATVAVTILDAANNAAVE